MAQVTPNERGDERIAEDAPRDGRGAHDHPLPHGERPHAERPHDAQPSGIGQVMASGPQGIQQGIQQGMQQGIQHAISEVAQERRPRGLVVRYGRAWLLGYALVVAAVVALAFAAHAFSVLPGDVPFTREVQENRNPIVFWWMSAVSWLGFEPQAIVIVVLGVLGLWVVRLRLEAIFLLLSELADAIAGILKVAVGRSRPSSSLVDVVAHLNSFSFPSGHTVHYTVFYGFLGFVIATNFRVNGLRQIGVAICIALIALVGPSRVYLGEHWPTDVLGGYLIGGLFLVPLIAAYLWAKEHMLIVDTWPFFHPREAPVGPRRRPA